MSAESFIVAWMSKDADVQKLAGSRIYPLSLPQGASLPGITYYRTGQQSVKSLAGLSGTSRARLTIDCWGMTYAQAKELAEAIRGTKSKPKLDGFRGALAGVNVQACFCTNVNDQIEQPIHGDEKGAPHVALDFDLVYEDV